MDLNQLCSMFRVVFIPGRFKVSPFVFVLSRDELISILVPGNRGTTAIVIFESFRITISIKCYENKVEFKLLVLAFFISATR